MKYLGSLLTVICFITLICCVHSTTESGARMVLIYIPQYDLMPGETVFTVQAYYPSETTENECFSKNDHFEICQDIDSGMEYSTGADWSYQEYCGAARYRECIRQDRILFSVDSSLDIFWFINMLMVSNHGQTSVRTSIYTTKSNELHAILGPYYVLQQVEYNSGTFDVNAHSLWSVQENVFENQKLLWFLEYNKPHLDT